MPTKPTNYTPTQFAVALGCVCAHHASGAIENNWAAINMRLAYSNVMEASNMDASALARVVYEGNVQAILNLNAAFKRLTK